HQAVGADKESPDSCLIAQRDTVVAIVFFMVGEAVDTKTSFGRCQRLVRFAKLKIGKCEVHGSRPSVGMVWTEPKVADFFRAGETLKCTLKIAPFALDPPQGIQRSTNVSVIRAINTLEDFQRPAMSLHGPAEVTTQAPNTT